MGVQRTWSEGGGGVERCKDGDDRWVHLPASALAALRAHCEAMELEASLKEWTPEQRQLVFPNTVGGVTRYGAFPRARVAAAPARGRLAPPQAACDAALLCHVAA